jgi:dipeptidyl aminopeptidase/acylaminoacyl peptidase
MTTAPDVELPAWETRFRSPRHTLPAWAKQRTDRCIFVGNESGTTQVYAWDRAGNGLRQVTDRPQGVVHCAICSSGRWIWWFADDGGDEYGVWMRQPFGGGPDEPATPFGPAWRAGLAMGIDDHVLLGRSSDDGFTTIHHLDEHGDANTIYRCRQMAYALDMSWDLRFLAIEHSEDDDARNLAVRVLDRRGQVVTELAEPDGGLQGVRFSPVVGDSRLLLLHVRDGRWAPLIVDVDTGEKVSIDLALSGDVEVDWRGDGDALLVQHNYRARTELHSYHLGSGSLAKLDQPPGTVREARARPDGSVWLIRSSAGEGPIFTATSGEVELRLAGPRPVASTPVTDAWVEGRGGPIHVLVSRPEAGASPYPSVVLLHGGPDDCDRDEFNPEVAAWVDHGFAVIRLNYRGSTGYGEVWSDALVGRVGLTELEDVAEVRRWAVDEGLADADRLVLAGSSWGGYLALLGAGTQPDDWSLAIADAPIADYVAAYDDAMEEVRALDRALFGGSPSEMPDRFRESSPITYVESVKVPVFVSVGDSDARCSRSQVESYVAELDRRGVPHELFVYSAGHQVCVVDEQIDVFRRSLSFALTWLARR